MMYRTDLALEAAAAFGGGQEGYTVRREAFSGRSAVTVEIHTPEAAERLQKPMGKYCTIELPPFSDEVDPEGKGESLIAKKLREMLPPQGEILVMGLGNRSLTADALGPKTADRVLATRHIREELARVAGLENLRPVAVSSPGVLGITGIETAEILRSLVQELQPAAVVAVDALAAMDLHRMGRTVQLSDSGIAPGAGVGNCRPRLDQDSMGVPVIGVGVPTVVDGMTLAAGLLHLDETERERLEPLAAFPPLTVTVREVDLLIARAASMVGMAINRALNPQVDRQIFLELTEGT